MRVILLLIACGRFSETCVEIASLNYLSIIAILSLSLSRKNNECNMTASSGDYVNDFSGYAFQFSFFIIHQLDFMSPYTDASTLLVFALSFCRSNINYNLISSSSFKWQARTHTRNCLTNLLTMLNVLLWLVRLDLAVDIVAFCVWLTLSKITNWFISPMHMRRALNKRKFDLFSILCFNHRALQTCHNCGLLRLSWMNDCDWAWKYWVGDLMTTTLLREEK